VVRRGGETRCSARSGYGDYQDCLGLPGQFWDREPCGGCVVCQGHPSFPTVLGPRPVQSAVACQVSGLSLSCRVKPPVGVLHHPHVRQARARARGHDLETITGGPFGMFASASQRGYGGSSPIIGHGVVGGLCWLLMAWFGGCGCRATGSLARGVKLSTAHSDPPFFLCQTRSNPLVSPRSGKS
jgi:hypothetical protein